MGRPNSSKHLCTSISSTLQVTRSPNLMSLTLRLITEKFPISSSSQTYVDIHVRKARKSVIFSFCSIAWRSETGRKNVWNSAPGQILSIVAIVSLSHSAGLDTFFEIQKGLDGGVSYGHTSLVWYMVAWSMFDFICSSTSKGERWMYRNIYCKCIGHRMDCGIQDIFTYSVTGLASNEEICFEYVLHAIPEVSSTL